MKNIELSHIEMNGVKYPIYCDLNVLELIQEEFTSVNKFERDLMGLTPLIDENGDVKRNEEGSILNLQGEPKIKAIVFGLYLMIREGQRIDSRQTGKEWEELTIDEIRELCTIPFGELAQKLHEEFNRCFDIKKKSKRATSRRKSTST
jgi:hypothetical protein